MLGPTTTVTSNTLAKTKRIRKRREFLRVQRYGFRAFGRFVVIISQRAAHTSAGRIGITVPKKVGAAHVRNKIKRRIRHIFRLKQSLFFEKNIVIIARSSSSSAAFLELRDDITGVCARLRHEKRAPSLNKS